MKIKLKAIQFENYKNIRNGQILWLEDITALVGANESGKTNVLKSIERLGDSLEAGDDKLGAPSRKAILKFLIKIYNEEFINLLKGKIKNYSDGDFILLKQEGEDVDISLGDNHFRVKTIQPKTKWKNVSGQQITEGEVVIAPDDSFYPNILSKSALMRSAKKKQISKIANENILKEIEQELLDKLPEVESWDYRGDEEDEAEYYIPNSVPWQQFRDNFDSNSPTKNLFLVAERENEQLSDSQQQLKDLATDGTQIQNFLNEVSDTINNLIKNVWSQSVFELKLTYQSDSLRIDTYEGGELKPPSVRSEGMKWFLSFLIDFHARGKLADKIILFDQPAERLHPGGQKELMVRLKSLVPENQIIYSTQSPFLIDRNYWSGVRFLKKVKGESKITLPSKEDVENDELLRSSLGFTLADVGQANEFNIITEGFTDSFMLLEWVRVINEASVEKHASPIIDLNRTSIFDKHGRGSIRKGVTELESSGLTAIGLYDADGEGLVALKDARKNKSLAEHFTSFRESPDVNDLEGGEDLVPEDIFKDACKSIFPKTSPADINKMTTRPRWKNICTVKEFKKPDERDIKDSLWEKIIENLKGKPLDIKVKEAKSAQKVLESCRNILDTIYEKKQRSI